MTHDDSQLHKIKPVVEDVVRRRADGRPASSDAFTAFAACLSEIGVGQFTLWWQQMIGELKQANPNTSPASLVVLCAAILEAALTFAAWSARAHPTQFRLTPDTVDQPQKWKLNVLIKAAAAGDRPLLDQRLRQRADDLNDARQRIHAGRFLGTSNARPPDLRPEEAQRGKETAEAVVRAVIDWLKRTRS